MKVIKRDGRIVEYDRSKISVAIEKANNEVHKKEKATQEDIQYIIDYIEDLSKKRILVEDIQDIIEQKLMELGKYELAKKYIVYRYTRALIRKSNTTDESILGLIRRTNTEVVKENQNKSVAIAPAQRDLIAGEVSKDLSKRILLPEKITKAHDEGILYFHDMDYFLQPIINWCLINIGDMLDNGTVINGVLIESPKTFQGACIITTQIIESVASGQYGEQYIDIKHLGKYLRKSYDKYKKELIEKYKDILSDKVIEDITQTRLKTELRQGIQTLQYQINTLVTTNGHSPSTVIFLHLDYENEYVEENAMIIEEILKQRYQGVKNEQGEYIIPQFPKLIYVLEECNNLKGGKYDYLTKLAKEYSAEKLHIDYISTKQMRENQEGKFNQGVVSINLHQIGIDVNKDEKRFWELLDQRLELCKDALMMRHYALVGTSAEISPIHWRYGAIARLEPGEKIDKLLYGKYSSISLGYMGLHELTEFMTGVSYTDSDGRDFEHRIIKHLEEIIDKWTQETNIEFTLKNN